MHFVPKLEELQYALLGRCGGAGHTAGAQVLPAEGMKEIKFHGLLP